MGKKEKKKDLLVRSGQVRSGRMELSSKNLSRFLCYALSQDLIAVRQMPRPGLPETLCLVLCGLGLVIE